MTFAYYILNSIISIGLATFGIVLIHVSYTYSVPSRKGSKIKKRLGFRPYNTYQGLRVIGVLLVLLAGVIIGATSTHLYYFPQSG